MSSSLSFVQTTIIFVYLVKISAYVLTKYLKTNSFGLFLAYLCAWQCTSHPKIILYQDIKLPEDWRNCAPKQTKRSTRSYLSLPVNSLPGEQIKKNSAEDRDRSRRVVPPQEELLSIMFLSILEYFIFPYYQK